MSNLTHAQTQTWKSSCGSYELRLAVEENSIHLYVKTARSDGFQHANPYTFGSAMTAIDETIATEMMNLLESTGVTTQRWWKHDVNEYVDSKDIEELQRFIEDDVSPAYPFLHTHEFMRFWVMLYAACFPVLIKLTQEHQDSIPFCDGFYTYNIPPEYRPAHSARRIRDFITMNYGQYHRGISRLLFESRNYDLMEIGYLLKDFADLSYIYEAMQIRANKKPFGIFEPCNIDVEAIKKLSPTVKRNLTIDAFTSDQQLFAYYEGSVITDASYMVGVVNTPSVFSGVHTWQDLHDRAMDAIIPIQPGMVNHHQVALPQHISKMNELPICNDTYTLHTMDTVNAFIETGEKLDICVGSAAYYAKTKRQESYCINIQNQDGMYGCVEIAQNHVTREWEIIQLRGYKNNPLDDQANIRQDIIHAMHINLVQ